MVRDGFSPVAWCESYLGRERYAESDRGANELRALARVLEIVAMYDQVNMAASFEHLARRW